MSGNPHQKFEEKIGAIRVSEAADASLIAPLGTSTSGSASGSVPDPALETLLRFSSLHEELQRKKKELARAGANAERIRGEVLQTIAERALAISGASGVGKPTVAAKGMRTVTRVPAPFVE